MSVPPLPEAPEEAAATITAHARAAALLPQPRIAGPMPWVIAILIALVVMAAAGGLALRNLADAARSDLAAAVTVQVIEPNPDLRGQRAEAAVAALEGMELVRSVRLVPQDELAELLEPWLGAAATSGDVPIPALIDVELVRRASSGEVAAIATALADVVPEARVDAQGDWLRPVYRALAALQWLALGLIALVALATAAAVWLSSRNAFASARDTVEIIHLLGGTDNQITGIFLRTVLREAAFGALLGTMLGLGAAWLLGQQFAALDSGMVGAGVLRLADWLAIALVPVAGVLLALGTARMTIALALRDML
ncbi:cell division protein FtsX [Erythrobacter dokdonensis]|jgi:cell division transport system permease protein|uniref:Cell division transport system permease protein n=1 Tax=Erythrobacter dokdonensis DSW-74 TaxID=1300349 RepID=A0A1A7BCL9_9SPHN|nr:cell division protein [Erythrobacter dokdonensis]MEE4315601.1 cell division protein [Erythrobacter sp.]OBV10244.1 cell division transport system permease protein [Erythrobacter dokdonensis DSW-74]